MDRAGILERARGLARKGVADTRLIQDLKGLGPRLVEGRIPAGLAAKGDVDGAAGALAGRVEVVDGQLLDLFAGRVEGVELAEIRRYGVEAPVPVTQLLPRVKARLRGEDDHAQVGGGRAPEHTAGWLRKDSASQARLYLSQCGTRGDRRQSHA
ncbi:hypothetical protein VTN96DRAFT_2181 [Rasamsonia emersonii]